MLKADVTLVCSKLFTQKKRRIVIKRLQFAFSFFSNPCFDWVVLPLLLLDADFIYRTRFQWQGITDSIIWMRYIQIKLLWSNHGIIATLEKTLPTVPLNDILEKLPFIDILRHSTPWLQNGFYM